MLSCEEKDIEKLRALCRRWNLAASDAGYCGSEYIDYPKLVFTRVKDTQRSLMSALVSARKQAKV